MQRECPWTHRELSIVRLLSLGLSAKEIARETVTSPNTINGAMQIIKLKAAYKGTTVGLIAESIRRGWIE